MEYSGIGKGAFVKDIPVYKVEMKDSEDEKELFSDFVTYNPDYIVFTSSLTFKTFSELARKFGMEKKIFEVLEHAKIAAIGDLTACRNHLRSSHESGFGCGEKHF